MKYVSIWEISKQCHHTFPESWPTQKGQTLFVHPDSLPAFVDALKDMNDGPPFVLVTGCSDYTIPFHFPQQSSFLLKHPLVLKWYAQNCAMRVGKLEPIPIGMDYHPRVVIHVPNEVAPEGLPVTSVETLVSDGLAKIENGSTILTHDAYSPEKQEEDIEQLRGLDNRTPIAYGNFHFFTGTLYGDDRAQAKQAIPSNCIEYEAARVPRQKMFERMASYRFIASPFGNGLDCHRTWEALALGCIPIVRSSGLDSLFQGLPVLIVNAWSDVTRELLDSFVPDTSQLEKLTQDYWMKRLNSHLL
jgi:hypothetical protein